MRRHERRILPAAVLAGLGALSVAGPSDAVHVNHTGAGQILIYPYYTTRAAGGGAGRGHANRRAEPGVRAQRVLRVLAARAR